MEDIKKLYPKIDTNAVSAASAVSESPQVITQDKLEELTDSKLSKSRADEIKAKVNEL